MNHIEIGAVSKQHNKIFWEYIKGNVDGSFLTFVVPSIMFYSGEISPTRCNNCVFYSQWLYPTCVGWQSHPSSGVHMLYMATGELAHLGCYSGEISPTRCNNCVFYSQLVYSTCFGWQSHPSSGVQCCIWPQVSWLTYVVIKFVSSKVVLSLWSCR